MDFTEIKYPKLRNDIKFKKAVQEYFLLEDELSGNLYRFKTPEFYILKQMNGMHSIDEILALAEEKLNYEIDKETLLAFIKKLVDFHLLEEEGSNSKEKNRKSMLSFDVLNLNIEKFTDVIFKYTKFFIKKWIIVINLLIITFCLFHTIMDFRYGKMDVRLQVSNVVVLILLLYITSFFHEVGHISACYYYRIKVKSFGIKLLFFIPLFFITCPDVWLHSKKERLLIRASGLYYETIFYSTIYLVNFIFFHSPLLSFILFGIFIKIILNIIPFFPNDGHSILSELFNCTHLLNQTREYVLHFFKKGNYGFTKSRQIIYFLYGFASIAFWTIFLVRFFRMIKI